MKYFKILTEIQKSRPRSPGDSCCGSWPKRRNGSGYIQWSPGPPLCRSMWLVSANSTSLSTNSRKQVHFFRSRALYPLEAWKLVLDFGELTGCAVRRAGRSFGLVSSLSASTAAAGWGSVCSAASHLPGAEEKRWPLDSYKEWHCISASVSATVQRSWSEYAFLSAGPFDAEVD